MVAGFAAAVSLSPRLLKLRPDSLWVQRIAPLSLLFVLLLVLPAAGTLRHSIVATKRAAVEQAVERFRQWTATVQEVTGRDWHLEEDPQGAAQAVGALAQIRPAEPVGDAELWRSAAVLNRGSELSTGAKALATAAARRVLLAPAAAIDPAGAGHRAARRHQHP